MAWHGRYCFRSRVHVLRFRWSCIVGSARSWKEINAEDSLVALAASNV